MRFRKQEGRSNGSCSSKRSSKLHQLRGRPTMRGEVCSGQLMNNPLRQTMEAGPILRRSLSGGAVAHILVDAALSAI